jgi:diguanylate cyclase (GGDEF)-like protein/PAS domain S-box-containing protein
VDTAGRFTSFNPQFAEMWRLPARILLRRNIGAATAFVRRQLVHPESFIRRLEELSENRQEDSYDLLEFVDGRVFEGRSQLQRVDGQIVGRVWSFRDVTDRKHLEERLSYQAIHDSLTVLGNRARFLDRLEHAVTRIERSGDHLAVLFLDMDNFKSVNDSLGHSGGDMLLQTTAHRLTGCLRTSDTAARLGGDEFGVVIEDLADPREAIALADRILAEVRRPFVLAGIEFSASVSVGVAFGRAALTSDELLRRADLAMYSAKMRGGNSYEEFTGDMLGEPDGRPE